MYHVRILQYKMMNILDLMKSTVCFGLFLMITLKTPSVIRHLHTDSEK